MEFCSKMSLASLTVNIFSVSFPTIIKWSDCKLSIVVLNDKIKPKHYAQEKQITLSPYIIVYNRLQPNLHKVFHSIHEPKAKSLYFLELKLSTVCLYLC